MEKINTINKNDHKQTPSISIQVGLKEKKARLHECAKKENSEIGFFFKFTSLRPKSVFAVALLGEQQALLFIQITKRPNKLCIHNTSTINKQPTSRARVKTTKRHKNSTPLEKKKITSVNDGARPIYQLADNSWWNHHHRTIAACKCSHFINSYNVFNFMIWRHVFDKLHCVFLGYFSAKCAGHMTFSFNTFSNLWAFKFVIVLQTLICAATAEVKKFSIPLLTHGYHQKDALHLHLLCN